MDNLPAEIYTGTTISVAMKLAISDVTDNARRILAGIARCHRSSAGSCRTRRDGFSTSPLDGADIRCSMPQTCGTDQHSVCQHELAVAGDRNARWSGPAVRGLLIR